jgi:hypothetical protein
MTRMGFLSSSFACKNCVQQHIKAMLKNLKCGVVVKVDNLTLSARPPFQNFSTPCILNVNNTGAKQGSIMK